MYPHGLSPPPLLSTLSLPVACSLQGGCTLLGLHLSGIGWGSSTKLGNRFQSEAWEIGAERCCRLKTSVSSFKTLQVGGCWFLLEVRKTNGTRMHCIWAICEHYHNAQWTFPFYEKWHFGPSSQEKAEVENNWWKFLQSRDKGSEFTQQDNGCCCSQKHLHQG